MAPCPVFRSSALPCLLLKRVVWVELTSRLPAANTSEAKCQLLARCCSTPFLHYVHLMAFYMFCSIFQRNKRSTYEYEHALHLNGRTEKAIRRNETHRETPKTVQQKKSKKKRKQRRRSYVNRETSGSARRRRRSKQPCPNRRRTATHQLNSAPRRRRPLLQR